MKTKKLREYVIIVLVATVCLLLMDLYTSINAKTRKVVTVVIDAGHGGKDGGAKGIDGTLEKDINLKIALKVQQVLQNEGIQVVMTRTADIQLCQGSYSKAEDMRIRQTIIDNGDASLAISIHQNSYSTERTRGAQVFCYRGSVEGKKAGVIFTEELEKIIGTENVRNVKEDGTLFMLKRIKCTGILIETGFITNWGEAALLNTDDYQNKLAEAIKNGVVRYLEIED
ncbi:MAG: putative rane protein [Clostridiales bacterium]|jgi:N-acetylmuramoyl-L-alanine amidase|nr:putative rane protein [Clostridiales bacterium]